MESTAGEGVWTTRPGADEHADYYGRYISQAPEGDVVSRLERQLEGSLELLRAVPPERETYRYAPDKWSIREAVGHVVDVERLFAFRALCFSRGDAGPLPGMEQDDWNRAGEADRRPLGELLDEWTAVRAATVRLFRPMSPEMVARRGTASGFQFTVRAFPWIIAGHELHHLAILREQYGLGSGAS